MLIPSPSWVRMLRKATGLSVFSFRGRLKLPSLYGLPIEGATLPPAKVTDAVKLARRLLRSHWPSNQSAPPPPAYKIQGRAHFGESFESSIPMPFLLCSASSILYLMGEGRHFDTYEKLGAPRDHTRRRPRRSFRRLGPSARRVSIGHYPIPRMFKSAFRVRSGRSFLRLANTGPIPGCDMSPCRESALPLAAFAPLPSICRRLYWNRRRAASQTYNSAPLPCRGDFLEQPSATRFATP